MTAGRVHAVEPVPCVWMRLTAAPGSVPVARRRVTDFARDHGADDDLAARIALAVTEAVTNVVRHAYDGGGWVECAADFDEQLIEVVVSDAGQGLRPSETPGLGAGFAVIADCCDDFTVAQRDGEGVEVWMRFVAP